MIELKSELVEESAKVKAITRETSEEFVEEFAKAVFKEIHQERAMPQICSQIKLNVFAVFFFSIQNIVYRFSARFSSQTMLKIISEIPKFIQIISFQFIFFENSAIKNMFTKFCKQCVHIFFLRFTLLCFSMILTMEIASIFF